MKRKRGLIIGALLIISLYMSTGQPVLAIGSLENKVDEHNPISIPATFPAETPASETCREQEIPDDGSWLQVCLLDPIAPDQGTVTEVNVKYILDHPDPSQLEVRLLRENSDISQTILENGKLVKGTELGEAVGLEVFNGTLAQGGWIFLVRDAVPGQAGWLRGLTVRPFYAPMGLLPEQLSGTPGRPTSFRFPPGIVEHTAPATDEVEQGFEEPNGLLELTSGWQLIKSEPFEISFPTAGWTLSDAYPDDGKEYWWDDDNSRAHTGYRAAWPAKGGTNGLNPPGDPYPPYAMSWMKYGPIDLSNAATAGASFWLWREIELNYDSIWFGISHDLNGTYSGWDWTGTADWEEMRFNLDGFYGDASVYVGWLFQSDYVFEYEGPWVDDAVIRKYVPGQVTPQGTFYYYDRNNNLARARFTKVYLYDDDPGGSDDWLATTNTDTNGYF